jgi:hypothetical protein
LVGYRFHLVRQQLVAPAVLIRSELKPAERLRSQTSLNKAKLVGPARFVHPLAG